MGNAASSVDVAVDPDRSKGWIRRFQPVVSAHKRAILVALVGSIIASGIQVVGPYVLAEAVDNSLLAHRSSLKTYVAILALLAALRFIIGYFYRFTLLRNAYNIEYDLRTMIYRHLTTLSASFYDRTSSGQLVARANSDVRVIQMLLAFGPNILSQLVLFLLAVAVMLTMSPTLTLVVVVAMPLVMLAGRRMRSQMLPSSWLVQSRRADITSKVDEYVEGVRVVKAYAREPEQLSLMSRLSRRLQWASVYQIDIQARWAPLAQNIPRLGLLGVLLYGGWLVIGGRIPVGDLVAFSAYVVMLQAPFQMLGVLLAQFQRAAASAGRILELMDEKPDITDSPDSVPLVDPVGRVEFDGISFAYPGRQVLIQDFTLTLEPGQTVALVGRTGCGKSTVAKLLARFYDISSGEIRIDGMDIRKATLSSLRKCVGVVGDDPFLFTASLAENISYANPAAGKAAVMDAVVAAGLLDVVEKLPQGMDTVIGERGDTLSGGERQRVAIARLLLAEPIIAVFDDATSSIDVELEMALHRTIATMKNSRTLLLVAHRLSTVTLADRVVLMEAGRIVAEGTHEELVSASYAYKHIFDESGRATAGQAIPDHVVPGKSYSEYSVSGRAVDPDAGRGLHRVASKAAHASPSDEVIGQDALQP